MISIDMLNNKLELKVGNEEIERRRGEFKPVLKEYRWILEKIQRDW